MWEFGVPRVEKYFLSWTILFPSSCLLKWNWVNHFATIIFSVSYLIMSYFSDACTLVSYLWLHVEGISCKFIGFIWTITEKLHLTIYFKFEYLNLKILNIKNRINILENLLCYFYFPKKYLSKLTLCFYILNICSRAHF